MRIHSAARPPLFALARHAMCLMLLMPACLLADERVEFNRDIRPILSDNCFACHGLDEQGRQADLRLDTFDDAVNSGVLEPGKPAESEMLRRMLSNDPAEVMPPPETERQISPEEQELVRRWIEQGAEYQNHWAWAKLVRPTVPAMHSHANGSAIDAFLQAGWQENQVAPADLATPRERLRRLSFDLRGLPPSPADVREFEQSPTDDALMTFRERWMNELAYAEHQAVRWLDLVRWADTSGFVSDEPIASGAYRAWVIEAFDANMPFDQFSIAQLAGDLLPNPTDQDFIASGYNRIVNTNCEAGAIEQEQLYKLKGEHIRALGTVWLGLTTGCAECHDHKFDPISAKDYYSLGAIFDDLVEAGVYTPGDRREPLHYAYQQPEGTQYDREWAQAVAEARADIAAGSLAGFDDWQVEIQQALADKETRRDFHWIPAFPPAMRILDGEVEMTIKANRLGRPSQADAQEFRRTHIAEVITGYVDHKSKKTDADKDAWFVDVWIDAADRPEMVGFQVSHGDYGRLGWRTANYETYYWGTDSSGTLASEQSWSTPERVKRMGGLPAQSGWVRLKVPFAELIPPVSGQAFEAVGLAFLQTGGHVAWGDGGLELRGDKATELELAETAIRKWWEQPKNRQVYQRRDAYVAAALRTNAKQRDALQQEVVQDAFLEFSQQEKLDQLRQLESQLFTLRSLALPVLVSRRSPEPKQTRLLNRGDYQDESGPLVTAALPEFLTGSPPQPDGPISRLDLARWLFSDQNTLTARVYVNRLWHQFYGRGLSETLEDAGTQGDWPSHLALLDWLACEFRDSGWNRDHMVRLLTSARAYQLSSRPSADVLERDPTNRWHARQGRYRLPAEVIRDSTLAAAGLLQLSASVPSESFFPYQPDAYWTRSDKIMFGSRHMDWLASQGQGQYARSVYMFWKRQNIHPTMLAFDAPTRQECTARRNVTNTPGQALALLNDPIFVEAARVFAEQLLAVPNSDAARIEQAFQTALQRSPSQAEEAVLLELLAGQIDRFAADPAAAEQLLDIGAAPPLHQAEPIQVAAWTIVTRTILNLHEFLSRS